MRRILSGFAAIAMSVPAAPPASLESFDWRTVADTLRLEFSFGGGRPVQYRIGTAPGSAARKVLAIDLARTKVDGLGFKRWPSWLENVSASDTGTLSLRIDLDRSVPWKSNWTGDVLQVDLIDKVHRRPLWRNPWVLGGAGAALAAGGIAVWAIVGGGSSGALVQDEGNIPRPGFGLPK